MTRRKLLLIVGLSLLVTLALATSVSAQEGPEVTADEVNEVASELYCPICENVPLDVCPTQACQDWREEIRGLLAQGYTEAEVQEYFVEHYGASVLGEPPRKGFTALVWILPGVGVLVGTAVLGRSLMQMRRPVRQPATTAGDEADVPAEMLADAEREYAAYVARLERELRDFS